MRIDLSPVVRAVAPLMRFDGIGAGMFMNNPYTRESSVEPPPSQDFKSCAAQVARYHWYPTGQKENAQSLVAPPQISVA
ncbi:MAG: hypothetical protein ACJ0BN_17675 [Limisphaerales bacterium]|nr:hypothetical protein [Verrucomicrobiae bacterium]|tara:strand:- start:323 stop:559 length:237 start_codon:yes stop_codon:yes gene_type:complete